MLSRRWAARLSDVTGNTLWPRETTCEQTCAYAAAVKQIAVRRPYASRVRLLFTNPSRSERVKKIRAATINSQDFRLPLRAIDNSF